MKNTVLLFIICLTGMAGLTQIPQAFKYQAVIRDNAGEVIQNQPVDIRIGIHEGTPGGTYVYRETHSVSTNAFGLLLKYFYRLYAIICLNKYSDLPRHFKYLSF